MTVDHLLRRALQRFSRFIPTKSSEDERFRKICIKTQHIKRDWDNKDILQSNTHSLLTSCVPDQKFVKLIPTRHGFSHEGCSEKKEAAEICDMTDTLNTQPIELSQFCWARLHVGKLQNLDKMPREVKVSLFSDKIYDAYICILKEGKSL